MSQKELNIIREEAEEGPISLAEGKRFTEADVRQSKQPFTLPKVVTISGLIVGLTIGNLLGVPGSIIGGIAGGLYGYYLENRNS